MGLKKNTYWILLAATIIVTALSYPGYRQVRVWRANAMATEAESLLGTPETMSRAWELAHAANSLTPNNPDIARTLARVYSVGDPASAYSYWQKVVDLSADTPDDRLELAKAYMQASLWQEFEAEIAAQREDALHPGQLDYLEALAATLQSDYEEALSILTTLVALGNAPHEADALFFRLTRISPNPVDRRAGIDHLWKIAADAGERRDEALKTIARLPDLELADVNRLIDTISQLDHASRDMQLLGEELRLRLAGADRSSIYRRASALFQLNDPAEAAIFGRWLNRHGLYRFTLKAIPLETAIKRQDLFLILIDAMALNDEWVTIRSLLEGSRVPIEDYLREFFIMRTFIETGDMRRARLAWNRALVAAARENPKLYYLASKARQLDLPEFQVAALERMVESPEMRKNAFKELIAVHQKQGKTADLHATLVKYRESFPDDGDAGNDTRYLNFLLSDPTDAALEKAQEVVELQPNILAYRMTLVLGLLQQNRSTEALELLVELSVNWFEVRDRWQLLAAVVLHREGFFTDAQTLVSQMDSSNLLPEEREFLREIRSKQ